MKLLYLDYEATWSPLFRTGPPVFTLPDPWHKRLLIEARWKAREARIFIAKTIAGPHWPEE